MKTKGYAGIGLDNPKNDINVGAVMRAAGVYGAAFVAASGKRYKSASSDTAKAYKDIPLMRPDDVFDLMPFDCVPVAVDLVEGAIPLPEYQHPERAYYIFGAEDGTLGKRVLSRCRDVIYVPTNGCMNLAATVNVVLYDRMAKQINKDSARGTDFVIVELMEEHTVKPLLSTDFSARMGILKEKADAAKLKHKNLQDN